MNLLKEYNLTKKRWLEANRKKDTTMMGLWERVGKSLKRQLDKRMKGDWN